MVHSTGREEEPHLAVCRIPAGEGHLREAVEHEHDEGEEDHAEVELALGEGVGVQLGAQEQGGRDDRHKHGQEEAEDVEEGVPLHQHKLSLHQKTN